MAAQIIVIVQQPFKFQFKMKDMALWRYGRLKRRESKFLSRPVPCPTQTNHFSIPLRQHIHTNVGQLNSSHQFEGCYQL
ncbi:MAG: hypothetical protein EZS28_055938 [Streblomastix strix]|uniref:Uncharacterized protein n=1 Tax=Streblomastix strix TaxID=222440 RepID=A0A5J4PVN4_9EUKA|nr:MAG: hypothetical protein EZS28_055938 [Streblomastix strix]